jgi:hypothetical protein
MEECRAFLKQTISDAEAKEMVKQQLASREEAFLGFVENAIYGFPASPYLKLLRHAGFELADIRRMVGESGIEATLETLHDAGVYVTQDEFKGRAPIRRNGLEFPTRPSHFDNPLLGATALTVRSSGSTGEPLNVGVHFDESEYRVAQQIIGRHLKPGERPIGVWNEDTARTFLRLGKMGIAPKLLFTTVPMHFSWESFHHTTLLFATWLAARRSGLAIPWPKFVSKDSVITIARRLARETARGRAAAISCHGSQAVRVCIAAAEEGLDITGTIFYCTGEPFTPTKAAVLAKVGARTITSYSMRETGVVAFGCGNPEEVDEMHLLTGKLAMVNRDHVTPAGETVCALIFTSLVPRSPKVLLNLYSGDYASVSQRDCGCALGELGMGIHLSNVRSYEKLTAEGVTFIGSKLYELVEEILPSRFGGYIDDYQLVEEEAESGISRLSIVVSPTVGAVDEAAVIETVLQTLQASHARGGGALMSEQWRLGSNLRVVRREVEATRNFKILPLRPLVRQEAVAAAKEVTG